MLAGQITVEDLIEFITRVKEIYENLGIMAAVGLPFLETLFPFLPLFLMTAFNLLAYGPIMGYLYTYIGTLSGTIMIFVFMRYISSNGYKQNKIRKPNVERALKWIEETHPALHILVLSIPFSPTFFINYSMGLTKMKWTRFLLITFVSRGLMLFICMPFGLTLINYYNHGQLGGVTILWLSLLGLTILLGIVMGQYIHKRIQMRS